jgi:hypothetical protein
MRVRRKNSARRIADRLRHEYSTDGLTVKQGGWHAALRDRVPGVSYPKGGDGSSEMPTRLEQRKVHKSDTNKKRSIEMKQMIVTIVILGMTGLLVLSGGGTPTPSTSVSPAPSPLMDGKVDVGGPVPCALPDAVCPPGGLCLPGALCSSRGLEPTRVPNARYSALCPPGGLRPPGDLCPPWHLLPTRMPKADPGTWCPPGGQCPPGG